MDNQIIIPIAEIWEHNIPNTKRTTLKVAKVNNGYYYLTYYGNKSTFYRALDHAKLDIQDTWGDWIDFKLLI